MEQLLAVIDQNKTAISNHEPGPGCKNMPRTILPGLYPDNEYDDEDDGEDVVESGHEKTEADLSPKIACRQAPKSFEQGPAIIDESGEELYTVAAVLDHRVRNRRHEYLIDWEGYGPEHRSWEPVSELKQHAAIREMIQDFHELHPDHPKPGTRRQKRRKSS